MVKSLFQKLLNRSGKKYIIDIAIPNRLLIETLLTRLIMLGRGFFFLRKKIFIGRNCNIKNKNNIEFGTSVTIENYTKIDGYALNKVTFGNNVKIGSFCNISCTSHLSKYGIGFKIGNNSSCGDYSQFGAAGGVSIGNDVIMGSYISFHSENHNFDDPTKLIRQQGVTAKGIQIGNNIWVGAKVTFLDGCKVGDNCVIAAGSVVTSIFPDNVVIGGVPAKVLKTTNTPIIK